MAHSSSKIAPALNEGEDGHRNSDAATTGDRNCYASLNPFSDDEIPDERTSPTRERSNSIHPVRPFVPGTDEERSLPLTPGSCGGSRRTLQNSIHFKSRPLLFVPLPKLQKRRSQFSKGHQEEEKYPEVICLPTPSQRNDEALTQDQSLDRSPAETHAQSHHETNALSNVGVVRANLFAST